MSLFWKDYYMIVSVCVGSSCHLKGSHQVITRLQELIKEYHLINDVELCASFCLGNCANGVSMTIDGELISNANADTIDNIFLDKVLNIIKKG